MRPFPPVVIKMHGEQRLEFLVDHRDSPRAKQLAALGRVPSDLVPIGQMPSPVDIETASAGYRACVTHGPPHWEHHLGLGRSLNSLAAVLMCSGRQEETYPILAEAEEQFMEMMEFWPPQTAFGVTEVMAVRYNASVLALRLGIDPTEVAQDAKDDLDALPTPRDDEQEFLAFAFAWLRSELLDS